MEFKEELELLLNNFIITKTDKKEEYYKIKSKIKKLREFTINKLGCDIIINSNLIKLEKLPSMVDNTYKIDAFDNRKDYVFLVLLIMFLEDKAKEEQFILSNLTTYITNVLATQQKSKIIIDFKDFSTRKSLVDVLKYATNLGIIKLRDGNDSLFKDSADVEALYENTGISHYIMRQFKNDIYSFTKPEDFLNTIDTEDLLNKKRYYTYRSLLYYPLFSYNDLDSEVYNYLIMYRNRIQNEIDSILDGNLVILKKFAFLTTIEKNERYVFPNSRKVIADIVLLVNDYLKKLNFNQNNDGFIVLEKIEFEKLLIQIHKENNIYFSKEYREMLDTKFFETVVNYMKKFKLLKEESKKFIFYPIIYLLSGNYKKDESIKGNGDIYNQMSIDLEV